MSALPATEEKIWREEEGKAVHVCKYFELPKKSTSKTFTMEEVMKHNKRGDCWIAIEGKVYDVSNYLPSHPGGSSPILALAGRDCTDAFGNYHPARVYEQLLPYYCMGTVADYKESKFVAGHRAIRQRLLEEGLFETTSTYYTTKYLCGFLLAAVTLGLSLYGPNVWLRLLGAVFLAGFWQQMAFLGHDVGHNAITHDRKTDSRAGIIIGNVFQGVSMAWWKHTHNVHHVATNSVDFDMDIQHMPLVAVGLSIIDWYRETVHPTVFLDSFARFMVSYQHYLFYPIMFLVGRYNLYIQSWKLVLCWPEKLQYRHLEICGKLAFMVWYAALLSALPPSERIPYFLISHTLAGILHVQIVLSHFAMPTYRGQAYNGEDDEWFRMQLMTCLNIKTWKPFDWVHGGLQFQIEHHLWPRLPRHNLRYASKLVRKFAAENDVPYNCEGFVAANIDLLKSLKNVAGEVSKLPPESSPGFFDSMIWEGMVARG